ncbi:hypothetical protein GOP47_0007495 [Adiantum capillus-veneris]|uniref:Uncharacterized protein n=1 Tax=Adiantum capillus-veneris TaxID=13818 RepID=A0A9D4V0T5_ADICA|nr:hypothetical protein GOP47_0007495 [Adiantum capillus-veneris]
MSGAAGTYKMQQQRDGDVEIESLFSADRSIKRLDFENIPVFNSSPQIMRAQAQQIRRDLERCKEEMTDPMELLGSLKAAAPDYANVDTSKLWEKYLSLKREFLQVEAENLFLDSYLTREAEPVQDSDRELRDVEKQLADLQSMTTKESEEIKSLVGAFAEEIEIFPRLMECALNHFDECDTKMHVESLEYMDEHSRYADSEDERRALELSILTESVQNEILELDSKVSKAEEYYDRIQNLHNTHTKLDLLRKVQSFFCGWAIARCENDMVTFALKNSTASKQKQVTGSRHMTPSKQRVYKLHVKVHPKTLAVENAQLEPKDEALVNEILKELALRRMMHSLEVSGELHNDLEFVLRRAGQRIASSR